MYYPFSPFGISNNHPGSLPADLWGGSNVAETCKYSLEKKTPSFKKKGWRQLEWRQNQPRFYEPGFPRTCDLCKVSLISKFQLHAHLNGKRHQKELRKSKTSKTVAEQASKTSETKINNSLYVSGRECTLCGVEFTSVVIEQAHLSGRRHLQNVKLREAGLNVQKTKRKPMPELGKCEVCDVVYTSEVQKASHLKGKRHIQNCNYRGIPTAATHPPDTPNSSILGKRKVPDTPLVEVRRSTASSGEPINASQEKPLHERLEAESEKAYQNYAQMAKHFPSQSKILYEKYQAIYQQYREAYKKFVNSQSVY